MCTISHHLVFAYSLFVRCLRKHFVRRMRKYEFDLNVVSSVKELLAMWDSIFDGRVSLCPELEWTHAEFIHRLDLDENDRVDMIIFQGSEVCSTRGILETQSGQSDGVKNGGHL
ncbi:uncharacterized protein [Henckelia pumila]|uniref:uncharacterized protein n=1 Tax=Henckelia pumila TaxID=405737 RepID=UPI003C6DE1C2